MSFLTIGGNDIPIAATDKPKIKFEEVGDRARSDDGTMRETITARKREWTFDSVACDAATTALILGYLTAASPLVLNGDVSGNVAVNVFCHFEQEVVAVRGNFRTIYHMTFFEQ